MAIFHCSIKIIGRNGGRSAVASATYRSGEKLYNEETGFTRKGGVVLSEILLPDNAPAGYHDRQTLWKVQKIEKRSDAQLVREVEVLPFPLMTQRTRRTRRSTASLSLTRTAGRRRGCVRARERNTSDTPACAWLSCRKEIGGMV